MLFARIFTKSPREGGGFLNSCHLTGVCTTRGLVSAKSVTVLVQVSAYGFITSNYWKFSDHYFERIKKPLIFYVNHDLSLEATLWKDLHEAGILWLYQR